MINNQLEDSENSFNNSQEWEVEAILSKRLYDDEPYYLVKWVGWPLEESTWEPVENLENAKEAIKEFEKKEKSKKRKIKEKELKRKVEESIISLDFKEENVCNNIDDLRLRKIHGGMKVDEKIYLLCEWEMGSDGIEPEPCYVRNDLLKMRFPKELAYYYQSKLKFV